MLTWWKGETESTKSSQLLDRVTGYSSQVFPNPAREKAGLHRLYEFLARADRAAGSAI